MKDEGKRKILISGAFWHGSLEESYARAFEALGWNVVRFDWEQFARAHPLATMAFAQKLLRTRIANRVGKWFTSIIEDEQPDLVLVIKGRRVAPETLTDAKRILSDRPLVNFNPDSPWEPANSSSRLLGSIPIYDAHFTWNKQLIARFENANAKKVHYLPFAYDPVLHHPLKAEVPNPTYDAMFVGTYAPERDELLGTLVNCNIRIVGNGWRKAKWIPHHWMLSDAVYGEDAVRVLSLGVCSINMLREQNFGSHNMRTFEIPASANAMLTMRSEEQSEWFTEGSDMECFDTPEELLSKIQMLASNPEHARTIARNGYEHVREETYVKRAQTMISLLGFAH
jgi:spore maturation protein CgeB